MFKSTVIAVVLMLSQPGASSGQTSFARTDDLVPVFRAEVWADTVTDFTNRVTAYSELRRQLESRLPAVTVTDDVGQLRRGRRALAGAIRVARSGAVQGEFFTAATTAQFQLVLARMIMNEPVQLLVRLAFRLQDTQIVGDPDWVARDRYDIEAKTGRPARIRPDEMSALMQNLLADRFSLKFHWETRTIAVLPLRVEKENHGLNRRPQGQSTA
jgi:hypothetical protein